MELKGSLLRGFYEFGGELLSATQKSAVEALNGNRDIIVQLQSRDDRSVTLSLLILQSIYSDVRSCQCLVLLPTRELALKTQHTITEIGQFMDVKTHVCIGGATIHDTEQSIQTSQPQIIIGTPGRVQYIIQRNLIETGSVTMLVLDETNEILSRGFDEQIYDIAQVLPCPLKVVILSATLTQDVSEAIERLTQNAVQIVDEKVGPILGGSKQFYTTVDEDFKVGALRELTKTVPFTNTVIFCNTRKRLERLYSELIAQDFAVSAMHGDMTAIERSGIMKEFYSGSIPVLIATNLLARGLDTREAFLVVNYDLPAGPQDYEHRGGNRKGIVINFVTAGDASVLREIEQYYSARIGELPTDMVSTFSPNLR